MLSSVKRSLARGNFYLTHGGGRIWGALNKRCYFTAPPTKSDPVTHQNDFLCPRAQQPFQLVLLNSPLEQSLSHTFLDNALHNAERIICADGGANRLLAYNSSIVPHEICGDLDSLQDSVLNFYRSKGTSVVHDPSQDSNDLQKCLTRSLSREPRARMVVVGGGGRLDHEMANLHALLEASLHFGWSQLYLLTTHSVACVMLPHIGHVIKFTELCDRNSCALVPLGQPCTSVTTTGLKWNLSGEGLQFGKLVSTSNEWAATEATVQCSEPLLWITNLKV